MEEKFLGYPLDTKEIFCILYIILVTCTIYIQ